TGIREVKKPANKCNGMTYDAELNLIVCEHATSTLVREKADGQREILASHFEGMELNSPNDVCVKSDGSIYFSDPWYGRMPVYGVERPRDLGWQGVFRVPPGGGAPRLLGVGPAFVGAPRRGRPASLGRALAVRAAQRALLLAGRKAALRQRHRQGAGAGVRPQCRR